MRRQKPAGSNAERPNAKVIPFWSSGNLSRRRAVTFELPEFILYALECRVQEANDQAAEHAKSSLSDYVESELANIITLRDIAELEILTPGIAAAVEKWLADMRA